MAEKRNDALTLYGNLSEDGETFQITTEINGVPIRVANVYVGDQREAFQTAHDAGQPQGEQPAK